MPMVLLGISIIGGRELVKYTNEEWVDLLSDPVSEDALAELREILVKGLRAALYTRVQGDLESLSEDFAQEALLKILKNVHTFRGESRFTTWAQKIAIHVAFTELRRRRWKDISLQEIIETDDGDIYTPTFLKDRKVTPEMAATQSNIMALVEQMIQEDLTERQRTALLAILKGGMPMGEVAKKLGTNRNALYKTIYDARQRMQKRIQEVAGLSAQEVMAIFQAE